MPNTDRLFSNVKFGFLLETIDMTKNYKNIELTVKKNHKWFSKDTYYLTCVASEKNIIQLMQSNSPGCEMTLGIDRYEFAEQLHNNGYKDGYFKTADDAQHVADYIKSAIVLKTLKI